MKLSHKIKVKNTQGLHARPAATLAKLLQGFRSDVTFTYRKKTGNAKSVVDILMLMVKKNASIIITVDGEDAQETLDKIIEAFAGNFGE